MRDFGLSLDDRNKVTAVVRDSQAARADVRVGDRIVALNDTPIGVSDLLSKRIAALPPGSFTIGLERGALGPNPNPSPNPTPTRNRSPNLNSNPNPYPDPSPNPNPHPNPHPNPNQVNDMVSEAISNFKGEIYYDGFVKILLAN